MEIIPGSGWKAVFDELLENGGGVVILGATDSGKSTMARYLIERFLAARKRACLVDTDVGQSALGPPGTICMKRFALEGDLKDYRFRRMFFVGDVNPAKRISLMIDGTKKMVSACGEDQDVTLVDTSGLISERAAGVLKIGKIRAISPRHVVAIQRKDELEGLLGLITDIRIHRPGISRLARVRKVPERASYRKKKFADYFNSPGRTECRLTDKEVRFLHKGRRCELRSGLFPEGTVIGLNRGDATLTLGLVIETGDREVTFCSPLASLSGIDAVEFGDIRLGQDKAAI
jgi:polynucleotide 5'-hydroxyl-kinase GRC3/NOL9